MIGVARKRAIVAHALLGALLVGIVVLATHALGRSRAVVDHANAFASELRDEQRTTAEVRDLLRATWAYALGEGTSDLARVKELTEAIALLRQPLEGAELLEAIDATVAASAWAIDTVRQSSSGGEDAVALRRVLSRIGAELDGVAWRLDAAVERRLDARDPDLAIGAWSPWTERAVFAMFAVAIIAAIAGAIVVARELSRHERRGADNERRERQLQQEREQLVAASRELRESLHAIGNLAAAEGHTRIEATARVVEGQLERIFDVTRLELGETSLRREYVDSRTLVERAMQMHEGRASARAIRLRSEANATNHVLADRERISDVLSTLIGNALAPARPGGEVVVTTSADERAVRFAIRAAAPTAIDVIERATDKADANNCDLFTCKRLVEAHGGRLGVDRATTGMPTYWFTLPDEPRHLR